MKSKARDTHIPSQQPTPDTGETEQSLRDFCRQSSEQISAVLGALVGELDYGLQSDQPNVRERAMTVALGAAEQLLRIARNLRQFTETTQVQRWPSDLSQLLLEAADYLEPELAARNIRLQALVESPAPALVDPRAIRQLALNSLQAVRESLRDGGDVQLSLSARPERYEISLRAVPASPASSGPVAGPGPARSLGLSVARALAEAHGGHLNMRATGNGALELVVDLPREQAVPDPSGFPPRRSSRRIALRLPARLEWENREAVRTELTVLSLRGAYLLYPAQPESQRPARGDKGRLTLWYHGEETILVPEFRVASCLWEGTAPGIGVEFLRLDPKAEKILAALIRCDTSF